MARIFLSRETTSMSGENLNNNKIESNKVIRKILWSCSHCIIQREFNNWKISTEIGNHFVPLDNLLPGLNHLLPVLQACSKNFRFNSCLGRAGYLVRSQRRKVQHLFVPWQPWVRTCSWSRDWPDRRRCPGSWRAVWCWTSRWSREPPSRTAAWSS